MMTAVCGWSSIAMAQFGSGSTPQGNSPTISPYINLLRGGNVGLNYYGLVRPQQDFAMQNQQLGQGIQSLQRLQQGSQMQMSSRGYGYSQLGITGHPVIFNSFGNGQFSGGYTGFSGGGIGGGGVWWWCGLCWRCGLLAAVANLEASRTLVESGRQAVALVAWVRDSAESPGICPSLAELAIHTAQEDSFRLLFDRNST